ncbi:isopenicillin N synthase family dioxygenase [Microbacterium trichothecenolyticum]|uniref:Isopenicillin N synthase-like dioxygenase n=1 Tax=Microbacterium trichothecenolyticum TaxID=69370 RepID=A0ABU0TYN6_MICTR|nr:2-oxoglutarate and iron-dependent oxygenase domain-containing protein [Microbacterium trichothecenolyticum]MDQ1124771.1 isopenicillin N synthase-like dioxygenase [Microbacterium trichothecenolyticum]
MINIPTIDLAVARSGADGRRQIARQIDEANRHVGFLLLVNHGIPMELLDRLYSVTEAFFDLPDEVKRRYDVGGKATSRGYTPPKSRSLANTRGHMRPGDLVELFAIGTAGIDGDPYYAPENAGVNFRPNVWPAEVPGFRETWTEYYDAMWELSGDVMSLFAEALGLSANYFDSRIDRAISNLFANHYPPITEIPEDGQIRVGEHTDYGSLTLLYQRDEVGGLEVFLDGQWIAVPATPGAFVVNIGDLMARWTNDEWISTLHRVQNPSPDKLRLRRISFPYFCQPNYDTVIEALPTTVDADRPAKYAPITSGQNMTAKTAQSFGDKIPDA